MVQRALRNPVAVGLRVAGQRGLQLGPGLESGLSKHLADASVEALDPAVGLRVARAISRCSMPRPTQRLSNLCPPVGSLPLLVNRSARRQLEQTFKNIDDILHKDAGCTSELDYTEQSS